MLPEYVQAIEDARSFASADLDARRALFVREVNALKGSHTQRGTLISGIHLGDLADLCERELTERAEIIWRALRDATTALARYNPDGLAGMIGRSFATQLEAEQTLLADIFRQGMRLNDESITEARWQRVQARLALLVSKYSAKARVFVTNHGVEPDEARGGTTINIQGANYGIVQTGDGAIANQTVSIEAPVRHEIEAALQLLQNGLATLPTAATDAVTEVRETAAEVRAEVVRPRPNTTRVVGLLSGISGAIRTVAALRPAYEAIQHILQLHFHVSLPPL